MASFTEVLNAVVNVNVPFLYRVAEVLMDDHLYMNENKWISGFHDPDLTIIARTLTAY